MPKEQAVAETDLVRDLRACANGVGSFKNQRGDFGLCDTAADLIDTLSAEVERLTDGIAAFGPLIAEHRTRAELAEARLQQAVEGLGKIASMDKHSGASLRDRAASEVARALLAQISPTPDPARPPKPGEVRTFNGSMKRFIEHDDRGEVWEILGPAQPQQRDQSAAMEDDFDRPVQPSSDGEG